MEGEVYEEGRYVLTVLCVRTFQARITMMTLPTIRADSSGLQGGDQGRIGKGWKESTCVCMCDR